VRLGNPQRWRSRVWWGAFLFALLTMSLYVIFDILDVDGSQMTGSPGNAIIVAETLQIEADRFLRGHLSTPDFAGLTSLSLARCRPTETRGLSAATTILCIRHSRMLPRVNLHRDLARASSPSADPA